MKKVLKTSTSLVLGLLMLALWLSVSRAQNEARRERLTADSRSHQKTSPPQQDTPTRATMKAEEKLVRDVYARLMRYQTAARDEVAARNNESSRPQDYLTFELRNIQSGPIKEISGQRTRELVTARGGSVLTIRSTRLSTGKDPEHAYYEAEWTTVADVEESSDRSGQDDKLVDVESYTSYEVTARLGGKERTYRALVLHRHHNGSLRSTSEILDNITSEMNTVLHDESPRVRSPWNNYVKSALHLAVAREITETIAAGKPLIPADAPIGYLPGDDVAPTATDNQTFATNAACVPDVRILQDGTDITDTTHDVIVGQQINLSLQVLDSTQSATNVQWTVPGTRVANYVANQTTGTVTSLSNLQANSFTYYWVDGADGRQVTLSCTLGQTQFSKTATFNVKRPSADITTTTDQVRVSNVSLSLSFGGSPPPPVGISFSYTITVPSGFTGTEQWIQTATPLRRRQLTSGVWQRWTGAGLDTAYPYWGSGSTNDSPSTPLDSNLLQKSANDSFSMWLMFRPDNSNSIWVPLRKVDWQWSGLATVNAGVWSLAPGSSHSQNPADANSTSHPTWTRNAASNTWVNE